MCESLRIENDYANVSHIISPTKRAKANYDAELSCTVCYNV
ncbi:MAG TPA: hypothetical protein VGL74_06905 [Terriglobales bacterium]